MTSQIPKIIILEELKRFIPPMLPTERETLKKSILREGCKTPLVVWRKETPKIEKTYNRVTRLYDEAVVGVDFEYILVDGHNRKSICDELAISYSIEEREFADMLEVREYMVQVQNSRRNLGALQRAYMIGAHYDSIKSDKLYNLNIVNRGSKVEGEISQNTAVLLARQYATSESSVKRSYSLYKAMRSIEKVNTKALMLCFQLLNAKELTLVEAIAEASTETIMCINNEADLREAIKEGKANIKPPKAAKVQNEPSTQKSSTEFGEISMLKKLYVVKNMEVEKLKTELAEAKASKVQNELSTPLERVVWVVDSVNSLTPKNKLQKACVDFAEKYKNVAFNDFALLAETVGKEVEKLNKKYANCSFLKVSSKEIEAKAYIHVQPYNTTTPFEIAINATKITSVLQGANIETCLPNHETLENPQIGLGIIENLQSVKLEAELIELVKNDLNNGNIDTANQKLNALVEKVFEVYNCVFDFTFDFQKENNLRN